MADILLFQYADGELTTGISPILYSGFIEL